MLGSIYTSLGLPPPSTIVSELWGAIYGPPTPAQQRRAEERGHRRLVAALREHDRVLLEREARETRKCLVGDGRGRCNLVTFGPGLNVVVGVPARTMPGALDAEAEEGQRPEVLLSTDLVQLTISNIPFGTLSSDIKALCEAQGIPEDLYGPVVPSPSGELELELEEDAREQKARFWMRKTEATVMAAGLDGIAFGPTNTMLRLQVQEKCLYPGFNLMAYAGHSTEGDNGSWYSYLSNFRLWRIFSSPVRYQATIPLRSYQAQKAEWDGLSAASRWEASLRLKENRTEGLVSVTVQGHEEASVGALRVRVEELLAGESLGEEYWNDRLKNEAASRELVDSVWREARAFLVIERKKREMKVWASTRSVEAAKRIIKDGTDMWEQTGTEFGFEGELETFMESTIIPILHNVLGETVVTRHPTRQNHFTLHSPSFDINFALMLIERAKLDYARGHPCVNVSYIPDPYETEHCPICFEAPTPILSRQQLPCGHIYCAPCLRHYLNSAITGGTFPLQCMGNDNQCHQPVPLAIIERLLPPSRHERLLEAALKAYAAANPAMIRHCITPGCGLLYRVDPDETDPPAVQCCACLAFCCPCSTSREPTAPHTRATECPALSKQARAQRIRRDQAQQERLAEEWVQANSRRVKRCPQCSTAVEKTEGCNHMTCRCGAHWCWVCRGVYSRGTIYEHIRAEHG